MSETPAKALTKYRHVGFSHLGDYRVELVFDDGSTEIRGFTDKKPHRFGFGVVTKRLMEAGFRWRTVS